MNLNSLPKSVQNELKEIGYTDNPSLNIKTPLMCVSVFLIILFFI